MTDSIKFSVLMTTYNGETPDNLKASLDSILVNQTVKPDQLVLVVDGPVSSSLDCVIAEYEQNHKGVVDVVRMPENKGQSKASAFGMQYVKYDLVARMDSDDISVSTRFERQINVFREHPEFSVVGGFIEEFSSDINEAGPLRTVPESDGDIKKAFRNRTPINNVTSMMKKQAIVSAGGYGRDTVNEDYSLYAHMWVNGAVFYNIQDVLVHVRVGNGMVKRRTDLRIFRDWVKDQHYLRVNRKHSVFVSFISCAKCLAFVLMPAKIKNILYKKVLRSNKTNG